MLEYNPKFESIQQSIKSLRTETENLEERIDRVELKLDGYDQNALLDSLVFQGIKQKQGVSLKPNLLGVINQNMGVNVSENGIALTYQFKMNNTSQSQNSLEKFLRFS